MQRTRINTGTPDSENATPHAEPGMRNSERRTPNAERAVGFKEWALVCDSMLRGETSLILRKGGIAEGRAGFRFKFERFYLFPTYFHEQIDRLRLGIFRDLSPQTDPVIITGFAEVEFTSWVDDLRKIEPLEPLHVMKRAVLEERFTYDKPQGLHLAFIRVCRLVEPWRFPYQPSYGGCRSWVDLAAPPTELALEPVLSGEERERRSELVKRVLDSSSCPYICRS